MAEIDTTFHFLPRFFLFLSASRDCKGPFISLSFIATSVESANPPPADKIVTPCLWDFAPQCARLSLTGSPVPLRADCCY
jgi:hypothetical protein